MNAQQALEYSMQPFIPMFIYGDYDAMESERQKGEEALKALVDEWKTNDNPGFGFDIILDLADRNRELCDQIGESRLRNLSSPMLSRGLSDADMCQAIAKMQGRTAASVAKEVRGDRDAYSVAYVRKPIKGTVLGRYRDHGSSARARLHHQRGLGAHGSHQHRRAARRRGLLLRHSRDVPRDGSAPL